MLRIVIDLHRAALDFLQIQVQVKRRPDGQRDFI